MTRPDIAFTYSILSRHNNWGSDEHYEAAVKLCRYLLRTKHYRLTFSMERAEKLRSLVHRHSGIPDDALPECFYGTDTSHGGERPMAGYYGSIYGDPFTFKGYRLPHTPLSSCQGEYVGCTKAAVNILTFQSIFEFIQGETIKPIILLCDNKAAVMLADNNTTSKRMKHIATCIAFLKECVQHGKIQVHHIQATGQAADIFTKALPAASFHEIRQYLIA